LGPLKILHVVTLSERGGAQRHVGDVAAAQVARGHDVHLACAPGGPLIAEARAAGVTVHEQPSMVRDIKPIADVVELARLARLIGRVRPDIVHGHSSKAGLLARLAARRRGVPSVYTAHGFVFLEPLGRAKRQIYLWVERLGARAGSRVIAVSRRDAEAAIAKRIVRADGITVIPNGYRPPGPPPSLPVGKPVRFLAIANPYPTKGLDVLIDAVRGIAGLPIAVEIAGDGPLRASLESRAAGLPVRFLGRIEDVPAALAAAHVSVLPSRKEGWPYAALEAMGAGRPVIATDVGGLSEMLDGAACGWIVPPGDAGALAAAMRAAIADPEEVARRGAAAHRRVIDRFTVESMVDRIGEEYARAVGTRTATR
jgi:glycosyltransferase involved in cell wall biosynthesis